MNPMNATQTQEDLTTMAGDGQLLQSEQAADMDRQEASNQATSDQATAAAPGLNISINELAAGVLTKAVDSGVAVGQFAVGTATGLGTIALQSVNGWFAASTGAINTQFSGLVSRVLGVKR